MHMTRAQAEILAPSDVLTDDNWLDKCDDMERAFVIAYIGSMSVPASARAAGYSPSMASTKAYGWVSKSNPTKPWVLEAVEFGLERLRNEQIVTREMVWKRMKAIAFVDVRKLVRWRTDKITETDEDDSSGLPVIREIVSNTVELASSEEIDDDTAAAIKSISQDQHGNVKIELHDPRPVLRDMAKRFGLIDDRLGIDVNVRLQGTSMEEADDARGAADAWQQMLEGPSDDNG